MSAKIVELEMQNLVTESIGGVAVIIRRIDLPGKRALRARDLGIGKRRGRAPCIHWRDNAGCPCLR